MSKIERQHRVNQTIKNMMATILAQQEQHIAYRAGYNRARRISVGEVFHGPRHEGVKAGFALHTYENQMFVLGFEDCMQDTHMFVVKNNDSMITSLSRIEETS